VELLEQADGLRRQRAEADALADRILPALFLKMFGDPATNPKGWLTMTLERATEITTGNTPSREDPENFGGGIPWARPADLEMALPLLHTAENISEKGALIARIVPAGSVLVCCIGATLGKVGLAGMEMAINQQINALLPSERATPEFLYTFCLLNARNFMAAATQATLPILNKSRFGQQPVFLPPIERQGRFSEMALAVMKQRSPQSQARQNLENIFATMLHRAFTGELTAKWREAHLKELLAEMEQQARLLRSPLEE
jgi:type I restriction enzyme S subunit